MISSTQILVFTIVLIITWYIFRKRRPKNFPPGEGPQELPLIGNLHQFGRRPHETFVKLTKTYGNILGVYFGGYPAIILNDIKSITEGFGMEDFSGRPQLRPIVERNGKTQKGVLLSTGKVWSDQRRFLLKSLRDLGFGRKTMEDKIQFEIEELAETFRSKKGKPISITQSFNGPVLNSIWHIMTGERFEKDDQIFKRAIYYMIEATNELKWSGSFFFFPTLSKIFPNWTGYNQFWHILMASIDVIKDTVKHHEEIFQNNEDPRDLIDVFLKERNKTSDSQSSFFGAEGVQNLTISLMDMFIAGAETTSTMLRWAFFILAQKVEEQELVFDEIKKVVGLSRLPSLNDRDNMAYTEAFIMETLRFAGMLPLGVFHSSVRDTYFQGYFIPKGTIVYSNLYAVLHDPKTWGDPEVFRPTRFLLQDGKLNRYHDGYIPFSIGKRVCLGEPLAKDELFLFIATLVQKFKVLNDPNGPVPSMNDSTPGLVIAPVPYLFVFDERQ